MENAQTQQNLAWNPRLCSSWWAWSSEWDPDSPKRLVDGPLA